MFEKAYKDLYNENVSSEKPIYGVFILLLL